MGPRASPGQGLGARDLRVEPRGAAGRGPSPPQSLAAPVTPSWSRGPAPSLSPMGYALLSETRQGDPRRRVANGGGNVIGQFSSAKSPRPLQYESLLEYHHLVSFEWDPDVLEVYDQPFSIPVTARSRRRGRHIPDFLVVTTRGPGLIEVKPRHRWDRDELLRRRTDLATQWAEAEGFFYAVFTEEMLPEQPVLENLVFLASFRHAPANLVEMKHHVLDVVRECPGITPWALGDRLGHPEIVVAAVWHLVWTHGLRIDLAAERLRSGAQHRIRLYPGKGASTCIPSAGTSD
jgi:hypothetical protein